MHWSRSRRIRKNGIKCFTFKGSNSVKVQQKQFNDRGMAPSSETQTYMVSKEQRPLLGNQNPNKKRRIQENAPRPGSMSGRQGPDGCLAWTVAFANFFINLAVVGLGRMSGILYVVLMKNFRVGRRTASVPFSVQQAARNLFGPLVGILGQKYGVRNVTVVGGIIGVISAVTCYFATNMNWIIIMWGLSFGICTALTTTLNQVPIDQYFEKHRTTAGGLSFSGGCVGAFFFPVVLEELISHYGMPVTFLAMGGIILVVIPAALFLREPPWKKKKQSSIVDEKNYNTFCYAPPAPVRPQLKKNHGDNTVAGDILVLPPPGQIRVDFDFLRQNCETVYQLFVLTVLSDDVLIDSAQEWTTFESETLIHELQDMYEYLMTPPSPEGFSDSSGSVVDEVTHSVHEIRIVFQDEAPAPNNSRSHENRRWLFMTTKLQELSDMDEEDILSYFPSHLHILVLKVIFWMKTLSRDMHDMSNKVKEDLPVPKRQEEPFPAVKIGDVVNKVREDQRPDFETSSNSFLDHLKTALLLHKNPLFLLICLCRGVFMLTFIPMVTIVVDFAVDQGLQHDTGKYVIATLSLGDLLGRLCLGWVTDSGCLSLSRYMLLVMVLLGGSTVSLPFMHSEVSLMPAVLVFGMLQGSLFIRHQSLVTKYMDSHEQVIGMGCINLLSGFLGFTLPYYIGYFRDIRGSYDGMFYVNGTICACVGLLWLLEPLFIRFSSKGKRCKYEELVRDTGLR